jgi:enterochelin esterase-like enzyme
MSLTGPWTTTIFWVLAAAAFAAGLVWPRSGGTTRWNPLRRAGIQLVVVLTAILAVAGTANAQNDWYSSWGDLGTAFGDGPAGEPVAPADAGGSHSGVAGLKPDPGPDGQYLTVTVPGTVSKVTGTVVVWVPRSYTQVGSSHRRYPVIEAFHGVPGGPAEYSHDIDLGKMVSGLAAAGRIGEAIVVMPDATPGKLDTECVNGGTKGPAMEDWLTQDVPTWVRANLRAKPDKDSWATMGLSAGGFCSMMATMLHPQTYGAAIELGGYLTPQFDKQYQPFAPASPEWARYDLLKVAATAPPVHLWLETSETDALSYPGNAQLAATVTAPLTVTADILPDAGHRMSVWVGVMPTALQWLGSTLSGFKK